MSGAAARDEALIALLAGELVPVRRLFAPWLRTCLFLTPVLLTALLLSINVDLRPIAARVFGAADMWLAVAGSVATAILAACSAMQLAIPGRSAAWALLPLPALMLWGGASGFGCLRHIAVPDATMADIADTMDCLRWIVGFSVPLSALMLWLQRRAYPTLPGVAAAMGGLACAAASASLLWFVHPYDASLLDVTVHVLAVGAVVLVNRAFGLRVLR